MTSRKLPPTGNAWGLPFASRYWTMKESKFPAGTFQDRRTDVAVASEAERSPRMGCGEVVGSDTARARKEGEAEIHSSLEPGFDPENGLKASEAAAMLKLSEQARICPEGRPMGTDFMPQG